MTRFASDAHLRSWAGFCPRNDESAGKRRSTRVRKGAPWLKTTLVSAAWAAGGSPDHAGMPDHIDGDWRLPPDCDEPERRMKTPVANAGQEVSEPSRRRDAKSE